MTITKRDQAVIIGEGLYAARDEGRAEGREAAAMVCEKESKEHIADSVALEEKGLLNLANDAFDRAMTCGLLAAKIRGED